MKVSPRIVENITWEGVFRKFEEWKMLPGSLIYFGPSMFAYDVLQWPS